MEDRRIEVYDIETLAGCYTYSGYNIDTKEVKQFVIHESRNDLIEMVNHIKSLKGMVGYNNLSFDYPIIHFILKEYTKWGLLSNQEIIDKIYNKAQEIINKQDSRDKFSHLIRSKDMFVEQMDLFKMWHYDNPAKSTSLKALEISLNYPNVMDMPIPHTEKNITIDQIDEVLEYNLNDVMATYEFWKKSVQYGKIELRKGIRSKFGLDCMSWNNGKIGEELILKLYCDKLGLNKWDVKKLRTNRASINLADCVPKGVIFKDKKFNELLEFFNNTVITQTKGSIDKNIIFKGVKYVYGTGGIHGTCKQGLYESDDYFIIKSLDVQSLYPNIPIAYEFYIEHLGSKFLEIYKDNIVGVRLAEKAKPKNLQDKSIVDGYKEAANIPYGKSNSIDSFLYDPLYAIKTCITGQLILTMLCERLSEIPECQVLMVNTDGCEVRIPRKHQDLYNKICKDWEKETKLVLEFADYQKLWMRDINNYGCITVEGKIKNKGTFEVEKVIGGEPAYYKDNSDKVIALAVQEYFTKGISVEETIKNHDNIYDFCARQKFIGDDYGVTTTVEYKDGEYRTITEKQQKNVRYYISNKGSSFTKYYTDGSTEIIAGGYQVKVFNKYIEKDMKDYNINYQYYIQEANKIINTIIDNQLTLF